MKEELYYILNKLLSAHDISINQEELNLQLLSHPSYPSLHALTGVLNHFNIENVAMEVPVEAELLEQLPNSFIAHIDSFGAGDFVLVEKIVDSCFLLYDKNKTASISYADFLEVWDGVILVVEKDAGIKKPVRPAFINIFIGISIVLLCSLLAIVFYNNANLFSAGHFILGLGGLYFSIAIFRHELGLASVISDSICNISAQTSCDEVLSSKGAQLFGWLKLSEASLVVFSTYTLTWILFLMSGSSDMTIMASLSLLALPITLYSLYYQYFIIRKWCPLCLAVVAILWLQAALVFLVDLQFLSFDLNSFTIFLSSFLTMTIIGSYILPLIRKMTTLEKLEIEHYKFKRKFSLFNALFNKSESLEMIAPIDGEIVFGNVNAPLEVIIVTNPFCFYCKQMHKDLHAFLKNAEEHIRTIIRFNVDPEKKDHKTYRLTSILLDIYNKKGAGTMMKVLDEVYAEKVDLEKWMKRQDKPAKTYESILSAQRSWCLANSINFTPHMVVDGKRYPQEYDKGDLVYFIDDLVEALEEEG